MKDPRLFQLKMRAEDDGNLSHPGCRLVLKLVSHLIRTSRGDAEDEFPMPWSLVSRWLKLSKDQCYVYVQEAEQRKFIKKEGLKGCPARCFYRLVFLSTSWRENPPTGCGENPPTSVGKKSPTSSGENPPHHIYKSFRRRKSNRGAAAPEKDGKESTSLRSQAGKGKKTVHAAAPADAGAALARERQLQTLRAAVEKEHA